MSEENTEKRRAMESLRWQIAEDLVATDVHANMGQIVEILQSPAGAESQFTPSKVTPPYNSQESPEELLDWIENEHPWAYAQDYFDRHASEFSTDGNVFEHCTDGTPYSPVVLDACGRGGLLEVATGAVFLAEDIYSDMETFLAIADKGVDFEFADGAEDFCAAVLNELDEDEPPEVFEWWLVSWRLGTELKERGDFVCDYYGPNIWGRATTGQRICADGIIQEIAFARYKRMNPSSEDEDETA